MLLRQAIGTAWSQLGPSSAVDFEGYHAAFQQQNVNVTGVQIEILARHSGLKDLQVPSYVWDLRPRPKPLGGGGESAMTRPALPHRARARHEQRTAGATFSRRQRARDALAQRACGCPRWRRVARGCGASAHQVFDQVLLSATVYVLFAIEASRQLAKTPTGKWL